VLADKASHAVKVSSCLLGCDWCRRERGLFVVGLAGAHAAEEAVEQVALGGGVPVAGGLASVAVARAPGETLIAEKAPLQPTAARHWFLTRQWVTIRLLSAARLPAPPPGRSPQGALQLHAGVAQPVRYDVSSCGCSVPCVRSGSRIEPPAVGQSIEEVGIPGGELGPAPRVGAKDLSGSHHPTGRAGHVALDGSSLQPVGARNCAHRP
jgi:hypothetical protein